MSANAFDWSVIESTFQKDTAQPGVSPGASDWWEVWHKHVATRAEPRWFYSADEGPKLFATHWPGLTKQLIRIGESMLDDLIHAEFRPVRLANGDVDWGANPDKTMSWAGFHYWTWANKLTRAYGVTADERYVEEVRAHLRSYFEQMDTYMPEPWAGYPEDFDPDGFRETITFNSLSSGAKMVTLADVVMVFRRAASWTPQDLRRATLILVRLAARLYEQYCGVGATSEFMRESNFLTSGASGLGTVAAIFPEYGRSQDWATLAREILETHVMELFYADGGHKELCTQYHKTGIRDTLFLEQVLATQGKGHFLATEPYHSKLLKTLRWLAAIMMPDGSTAVLNSSAAADDWLVFFIVANKWLRDPELAWHIERWFTPDYVPRQKAMPPLCMRFLGSDDVPEQTVSAQKPSYLSVLLPETGVAVLRDGWDRWSNTMVLDFGRPVGGHAYPARGSFSLYLRGRPAAMSPGSPHAYTDPDYGGWMHTSRSQNNVLIDDADQEQRLTRRRRVHGEILRWQVDADSALVQGRHEGYRVNMGIVHTRTVKLLGGRFFLVHDVLDASGASEPHVAKWSIHCPEPLVEQEGRVAAAAGLMRVVPAWPDRIDGIEFGAQGKVVWPGPNADRTLDDHRRMNHARWCAPVEPGRVCEFLMLIQPDDDPARIASTSIDRTDLVVQVETSAGPDTILLPHPRRDKQ